MHTLVEITPRGTSLTGGRSGPAAHLILALDLSASMDRPDKYPVLVQALRRMFIDLQDPDAPDVLISVVAFAMGAETILHAAPARSVDPRDLEALLAQSALRFTRYTDVGGALLMAGRIARDAHHDDRRMPLRIMVLTDGRPQDVDRATRVMASIERVPVDVDCFAFGADADIATMKRLICGRRGGTVKLVEPDTIGEAFERVAEVAQRIVAKRSLIDVELVGGVVGGAVFRHRPARHAFGPSAFQGGVHFFTDLGTLERGRTYSLVLQMRLPATTAEETEMGHLTLRVPGEGGPVTFEHLLAIPRHAGSAAVEPAQAVRTAWDIVSGAGTTDTAAVLASLRARRELLAAEQRSERLIAILDRAIDSISRRGSLEGLSAVEMAALTSHTRTVVHLREPVTDAR